MLEMNTLWAGYLNCAGLVIVGVGLLLVALAALSTCSCAFLCAAQTRRCPLPDDSGIDLLRLVTGL